MATAEELLNGVQPNPEGHIVIGGNRRITMPDNLKRLGVQYDHNMETVVFDCPRYWDDRDMSTMDIYINYMRPDKYVDRYRADNVSVDGDIMHFEWTISRNVTKVAGNISFLVCVVKTDAEGNEERHWNSELYQGAYISPGMEAKESAIDLYPDIITQLLLRMDTVEQTKSLCYGTVEKIIYLNDEKTVEMQLFPTVDGYNAVVTGKGRMRDYGYRYTDDLGSMEGDTSEREYDATKIIRLHIEKDVTYIGDLFMFKAYNLKHLSFADSTAIAHLGAYAFAQTKISGTYNFPKLEQSKLEGVFAGCMKLEGVTLNEKVTEIGCRAFYQCTSMRYVDGIQSVTAIDKIAFEYCTSLESVDLDASNTSNITLGDYAFMLTPNDIKICKSVDISPEAPNIENASWKSLGELPIVQNAWKLDDGNDYLAQLRECRPTGVHPLSLFLPEMDHQDGAVYGDWKPILQPWNGLVLPQPATAGCLLYSLLHTYNIVHPDAPYDTFYDFVNYGINPKKIKITESLYNAVMGRDIGEQMAKVYKEKGIDFTPGQEISAFDLPLTLNFTSTEHAELNDYDSEGSLFWGIFQVLGWSSEEKSFGTFDADRNFTLDPKTFVTMKELVINEMKAGRPVNMEIVGRAYGGHGAHAVVPIDYDAETDKFLIIDSANPVIGIPESSRIPLAYWLPFEALITPNKASAIRTFNFGKEKTMYDISESLKTIAEAATFRVKRGTFKLDADMGDGQETTDITLDLAVPSGAKILILEADADTLAKIQVPSGQIISMGFTAMLGKQSKVQNAIAPLWTYSKVGASAVFVTVNETNVILTSFSLLKGTYNWTAYYWDE